MAKNNSFQKLLSPVYSGLDSWILLIFLVTVLLWWGRDEYTRGVVCLGHGQGEGMILN